LLIAFFDFVFTFSCSNEGMICDNCNLYDNTNYISELFGKCYYNTAVYAEVIPVCYNKIYTNFFNLTYLGTSNIFYGNIQCDDSDCQYCNWNDLCFFGEDFSQCNNDVYIYAVSKNESTVPENYIGYTTISTSSCGVYPLERTYFYDSCFYDSEEGNYYKYDCTNNGLSLTYYSDNNCTNYLESGNVFKIGCQRYGNENDEFSYYNFTCLLKPSVQLTSQDMTSGITISGENNEITLKYNLVIQMLLFVFLINLY